MWVIDLISPVETVQSFYLTDGEWSIGRKGCHINLSADSSISRKHAVLSVGLLTVGQLTDPATRPLIRIIDQQSRFGTFINDIRCAHEMELKEHDLVSFGGKKTVLCIRFAPFVLATSRLGQENKRRVQGFCQSFGMHLLSSGGQLVTHCIIEAGQVFATEKVLWTLACSQYIVTTSWLEAIHNRAQIMDPLPSCEDHLPQDKSASTDVSLQYLPSSSRKELFKDYVIMFMLPSTMEGILSQMSGTEVRLYKWECPNDANKLLSIIQDIGQSKHYVAVAATTIEINRPAEADTSLDQWNRLLCEANVTFTTEQDLAANIIFLTQPSVAGSAALSLIKAIEYLCLSNKNGEGLYKNTAALGDTDSTTDAGPSAKDPHSTNNRHQALQSKDAKLISSESSGSSTGSIVIPSKSSVRDEEKRQSWFSTLRSQRSHAKDFSDQSWQPQVVKTPLIKRSTNVESEGSASTTIDYKKFRNRSQHMSRSHHSLFPVRTVPCSSSDAVLRKQSDIEGIEDDERIADELFEVIEKRKTRRKL